MSDNLSLKEIWLEKLNKWISVAYTTKNKNAQTETDLYYNGFLVDVNDNGIILDDIKLGKIPLSFSNLSLINIDENRRRQNE